MWTVEDDAFLRSIAIARWERPMTKLDDAMFNYQSEYVKAIKWNARLCFAVVFLLFAVALLGVAYYWETEHPRPNYNRGPHAGRTVEPVMPYHKRSY